MVGFGQVIGRIRPAQTSDRVAILRALAAKLVHHFPMAAPRAAARAGITASGVSGERIKVQNRRSLNRVTLRLSAVVIRDGQPHEARVSNLAMGGALVECRTDVPVGTAVVVVLAHWTGQLRLPANVRWNADQRCGVQFGQLGARERYAVAELLESADSERPSRFDPT
jgi:hypothetical protein